MKKLTAGILSAIMLLSLCACGDTSDGMTSAPPTETDVPAAVTAPPADTTPEPTPEATAEVGVEPEDPYYFQISDYTDGFPNRYDLSREESLALMEMIDNITPVARSEKQYDYWSGVAWPEGVLYSIYWDAEDGERKSLHIYEGDSIELNYEAYYDCEGVDHELLRNICSKASLVVYEKSVEDAAAAMDAFRDYFAETWENEGCSITGLRYDEAVASEWTDNYIHNNGKVYMDAEDFIVLILSYASDEGAVFYGVEPGTEALLFLLRDEAGEWEFSFCSNEVTVS